MWNNIQTQFQNSRFLILAVWHLQRWGISNSASLHTPKYMMPSLGILLFLALEEISWRKIWSSQVFYASLEKRVEFTSNEFCRFSLLLWILKWNFGCIEFEREISALQKRTRTKVLVLWVLNFTVSILGHLCNFSQRRLRLQHKINTIPLNSFEW